MSSSRSAAAQRCRSLLALLSRGLSGHGYRGRTLVSGHPPHNARVHLARGSLRRSEEPKFGLAGDASPLMRGAWRHVGVLWRELMPVYAMRSLLMVVSALRCHVPVVVGQCPDAQMVRVEARRVLALVANEL